MSIAFGRLDRVDDWEGSEGIAWEESILAVDRWMIRVFLKSCVDTYGLRCVCLTSTLTQMEIKSIKLVGATLICVPRKDKS
jgi:hypothetical protein